MEIGASLLTLPWAVPAWLACLACALYAGWRAPWRWLGRGGAALRLATAVAAVVALWQIRAAPGGEPAFHLLGATLLTLAFGWALALLALLTALAVLTASTTGAWMVWGMNGLVLVVLPVAVSYGWARLGEAWLPRHFFVYVFSAGFLGGALAVVSNALAAGLVLYGAGEMSRQALTSNYLPTALLLLFPEAFVTGGAVTLAAVYRPAWLASFSDARYVDGH
ncbi:MAG: energy-coupling factor ABC transporter permease [Gammaproteobacteria bacterium]|nr:energy-coupling factor ABC transporter permease [Gammaproteobacteria bacterium]